MKAKNRYIILIVFLSMIWTANAQVNINQFIESVTHSETTFTNGLNASVFTIDAPATGNYHIQFWLNPTTSDNVSFQSHRVIVNGVEIGLLNPTTSGWQSIGITDVETVMLYQGENEVCVIGDAISVPMIDMVRIACNVEDAEITTLENATIVGDTQSLSITELTPINPITPIAPPITDDHVALTTYYSFNKQFRLQPGQIITITTTAPNSHGIDFYLNHNRDTINNNVRTNDLNWYAGSAAYSSTSSNHRATTTVKIPVAGIYRMKLRSGVSGIQETIDNLEICVKDSIDDSDPTIYSYTNCKASYTRMATTIPANGTEYRVNAINILQDTSIQPAMPDYADVCIEGDASTPGRVVRYFSTGPNGVIATYNIGTLDAVYQIPATAVHVSLQNSTITSNVCYIAVTETPDESGSNNQMMQAKRNDTTSVNEIGLLQSAVAVDANQIIVQTAEADAQIEIYNLSGTCIYRGTEKVISISERGVYIVKVGAETYKVAI